MAHGAALTTLYRINGRGQPMWAWFLTGSGRPGVLKMSEYSAVRGGKLKLKSGTVGGHKKKKRKREHSKHDDEGEYKHAGEKMVSSLCL